MNGSFNSSNIFLESLYIANNSSLSEGSTSYSSMRARSLDLNAFSEQDKKLLETLASHVASAIQRIRLLEAQIQYEARLEVLHVHASNLADASSIEEISEYSKEAVKSILRPDRGDWGGMIGIVEDNRITWTDGGWLPLDGPGVTVRAVNTGESQLVNDVRKDIDHIGVIMDDNIWSKIPENMRKTTLQAKERGEGLSLSEIYVPVKMDGLRFQIHFPDQNV